MRVVLYPQTALLDRSALVTENSEENSEHMSGVGGRAKPMVTECESATLAISV
jgi:hypothetical protein